MMLGTLTMAVYTSYSIIYLNGDVGIWIFDNLEQTGKIDRELYFVQLMSCLRNDLNDPKCKPASTDASWKMRYYDFCFEQYYYYITMYLLIDID